MDLEKITATCEQFESSFDKADMTTALVENALSGATTTSMPEEAVESLLQQVSDEHGLQFAAKAADASSAPVAMAAPTSELADSQEDALEARLAALRTAA
jgi:charged multivesicular body protein 1